MQNTGRKVKVKKKGPDYGYCALSTELDQKRGVSWVQKKGNHTALHSKKERAALPSGKGAAGKRGEAREPTTETQGEPREDYAKKSVRLARKPV